MIRSSLCAAACCRSSGGRLAPQTTLMDEASLAWLQDVNDDGLCFCMRAGHPCQLAGSFSTVPWGSLEEWEAELQTSSDRYVDLTAGTSKGDIFFAWTACAKLRSASSRFGGLSANHQAFAQEVATAFQRLLSAYGVHAGLSLSFDKPIQPASRRSCALLRTKQ